MLFIPVSIKKRLPQLLCLLAIYSCNGQPPAKSSSSAPKNAPDRLRIMSYNVLKYGDGCQDKPEVLHHELQTIVRYASPDILGLVKVAAPAGLGNYGRAHAPAGFPQEILKSPLGAAFPARYALCPATNIAGGNNINLLFYDASKLGFAGMQTLVSNVTDFNLYRLYLKKPVAAGKDTTFLYILLNHTESGDDAGDRSGQIIAVEAALHKAFSVLPNVIDMGDFNMRNTSEPGYQSLIAAPDAAFRFADPPFALDKSLKYPADWESDPAPFAKYLTTSTRKKEDEPNSCGTGGAAKFWYDHILLSPSIAAGNSGLSYVKGSYHTIGNDGGRIGHAANAGKHPNTAVPAEVAEALFRFSNKYPVMLELAD